MDLLNRALEQVIDQLVTQKVSVLKLEIESQKKTIFDLSFRIEKKEIEQDRRFDDLERQNQLLTAKILLMENEKIMKENDFNIKQEDKLDFASSPHDDKKSDSDNVVDEIELTEEQKVTARLADNLVELLAKQSQHHTSTASDDAIDINTDERKSPYGESSLSDALLSYTSPASLLSLTSIGDDQSKCIPIGDGRVKCLICERELKRDSWKRHISSVHSNNRPYQCNMCNTTFKLAHDMYKHKRLKHGEEYQTKKRARLDDEKVSDLIKTF